MTAGADGRIEAHINRGADLFRKRHFHAALQEFDAAIGLGCRLAGLFYNRARALQELGRLEEALPAFEAALREQPDYPEALNGLGNVLCDLRRHSEALDAYDRVLQQRPEHLGALINRSNVRRTLGRFEDALLDCDAAVRFHPGSADAHLSRAQLLASEPARRDEALAEFDMANDLRPGDPAVLFGGADLLLVAGHFEGALVAFDAARAAGADAAEVLNKRGLALYFLDRMQEALHAFEAAVTLRGDFVDALNNRGLVFDAMGMADRAAADFDAVVALDPGYVEALNNRANLRVAARQFPAALDDYDKAIEQRSGFAKAHWNKAHLLLLLGDYQRGLPGLEWRWSLKHGQFPGPMESGPASWCDAESLEGKTLLLTHEQGLGDTLQFCRYARLAIDRGAKVILAVPDALVRLLRGQQGLGEGMGEGMGEVIGLSDPVPAFDVHCPMMSLPLAFGTTLENIPFGKTPYLNALSADVERWSPVSYTHLTLPTKA